MAKITLNGVDLEVPEGAPLVEVIKNQGIFISNLCYIDGLPPYAGCRTCLVEIEGARGLQLSCTARCNEGMIVRTDTKDVFETRRAVLSLIMSYHSDRCLTCHRVVKCKPGDTCLRDDTVTHRCLTCSKNYRCELQTTCEMLQMAGYEPWDGDGRTYYNIKQPEPDQANPFLEFDPQMCIICTRCVRACDEIRHTGAITLAGRGERTRIAFGAGGAVHDSNCDFCGACIDVCPTATLMEHPNKWSATQTERWTPTTCTQCSIGCSIFLGARKGRAVIVRPDAMANPVSKDQLCVRGRFHYDAVKNNARIQAPLIKRNGAVPAGRQGQDAASWDEALEFTAARIAQVREQHGPGAVGFLASPLATNEENYLLGKIARAVVGTNNIDSSTAPVARAAAESLQAAFGSEVLPADMTRLATSKTILVVADDLESSHNVAALRIKDAAIRGKARVVVISARWGELNDFAEVWVRPKPGHEAATIAALAAAVEHAKGIATGEKPAVPEALIEPLAKATQILAGAAAPVSLLHALPHFGAAAAKATVAALANIAVATSAGEAPQTLFVLPQEANVVGMRDVGAAADLLPGHRPAADDSARTEMQRIWGAQLPTGAGLTFEQMSANGNIKALVVLDDNPLMLAPNSGRVRKWLESLEFLAVIDSLPTDTANLAHAVLPDASPWAREGTTTSADRRVLRLNKAAPHGDSRQGWRILSDLGARLAERLQPGEIRINYQSAAEIMDEISQVVPLYQNATYREMDAGAQQYIYALGPKKSERQTVSIPPANANGQGFALSTGRSLYLSYEASAIHDPEADPLHRDDAVKINPLDAAALGISEGDTVVIRNRDAQLSARASLTEAVQPRSIFLPIYHDAGAVAALFDADTAATSVDITRA